MVAPVRIPGATMKLKNRNHADFIGRTIFYRRQVWYIDAVIATTIYLLRPGGAAQPTGSTSIFTAISWPPTWRPKNAATPLPAASTVPTCQSATSARSFRENGRRSALSCALPASRTLHQLCRRAGQTGDDVFYRPARQRAEFKSFPDLSQVFAE